METLWRYATKKKKVGKPLIIQPGFSIFAVIGCFVEGGGGICVILTFVALTVSVLLL